MQEIECAKHGWNVNERETCFTVPMQGSSVLTELNAMRLNKVLIDLVIKAGGREFPGHRIVFAASSPYFKAMFSYGLKESHERVVEIQGVTSNVMKIIVDYIYTGRCFFTKQNAAEVMMTADLFQMLTLKHAAVEFLMKSLDTSNCLLIRKIAEIHSCAKLFSKATKYCRIFFKDVILEDDFLSMDVGDVVAYLTDDELSVRKEDVIFDAAMRWIKHKSERYCYLPSVFKTVRLPFVTPDYLKRNIAEEPLIKSNGHCIKQVIYAREFQVSGLFSGNCENAQRRPRRCTSKEVLLVFGGETKVANFHERIQDMSFYDPDSRKWDTLVPAHSDIRTHAFCAVSIGYNIYITGGAINNSAVGDARVFFTYLNKWDDIASMNQARYHHSCAVVKKEVYAIGGTDGTRCLDHVERYITSENKWISVEPMVHPVKCPATAQHENKLYVLGGFADGYAISQSIQVYDPATEKWIALSCQAIDYTCAKAVTLENKIYLLGGCSKTVKVYDPKTDVVLKVADMNTKRDNCGVTAVKGKIYVTGGVTESNGASLNTAECYCPTLDKWESIPQMPRRLYRHGSVNMRIPIYRMEKSAKRVGEASELRKTGMTDHRRPSAWS